MDRNLKKKKNEKHKNLKKKREEKNKSEFYYLKISDYSRLAEVFVHFFFRLMISESHQK